MFEEDDDFRFAEIAENIHNTGLSGMGTMLTCRKSMFEFIYNDIFRLRILASGTGSMRKCRKWMPNAAVKLSVLVPVCDNDRKPVQYGYYFRNGHDVYMPGIDV